MNPLHAAITDAKGRADAAGITWVVWMRRTADKPLRHGDGSIYGDSRLYFVRPYNHPGPAPAYSLLVAQCTPGQEPVLIYYGQGDQGDQEDAQPCA